MHARITLEETPLFADPSGALYWPARRTLVLAEPDLASRANSEKLRLLVRRYAPARVVCLGPARGSVPPDWIVLAHEQAIGEDKLVLRHRPAAGDTLAPGEIVGGLRPAAALETRHGRREGPCFALDGRRMAMPAFGTHAGGTHAGGTHAGGSDVRAPALVRLFGRARVRVLLLGADRLQLVARDRLVAYGNTPIKRTI